MPDGDILPGRLWGRYQQSYEAICERKSDHNEIVWNLMKALLPDIKNNYEQPVKYAKHLGEILQAAIENVDNNTSVDWSYLRKQIESKVRQAQLKHYQEELLLRSVKGIIHDFAHQRRIDTSYLPEAVIERLFQEIYESNFKERILLTLKHSPERDETTVMKDVEALSSDILTQFDKWAKQAAVDGDVSKLRVPRRKKAKEADIKELVLA
jgi:hypothetical protein